MNKPNPIVVAFFIERDTNDNEDSGEVREEIMGESGHKKKNFSNVTSTDRPPSVCLCACLSISTHARFITLFELEKTAKRIGR